MQYIILIQLGLELWRDAALPLYPGTLEKYLLESIPAAFRGIVGTRSISFVKVSQTGSFLSFCNFLQESHMFDPNWLIPIALFIDAIARLLEALRKWRR
jgi:hypothetical protein